MTTTSNTPGQVVKKWAKAHPDLEAEVKVTSLTPKGKGGWGTTSKMTTFYIREGKAAQTRGRWRDGTHNGHCEACGHIFLDLVLMTGRAPDPNAGQVVPLEQLPSSAAAWPGLVYKFPALAHLTACPSCVNANGLDTTRRYEDTWDEEKKFKYLPRPHPHLRKFQYPPVTVLIDLLADTVQIIDRRVVEIADGAEVVEVSEFAEWADEVDAQAEAVTEMAE